MTLRSQACPLFKWRKSCQGVDQQEPPPTYWETKWRRRDKLIAFSFFCLACQYDDIVANVDEGGWAYFPVRILELLFVYISALCTSIIIKIIYGDTSSEPALKLSVFSNNLLTSETDTTIDMLHERDVETQTKVINYVEETSRLKQRHQREMRRLNRQRKGIKRCLANQWKEANRTMKDKNQLLSELYEKLVPLEKEMADHQTEKEIVEKQLDEERRRYTDLMTRVNRVQEQLETVGAVTNKSLPDNATQQEVETDLPVKQFFPASIVEDASAASEFVPNTSMSNTIQALHSVLQADNGNFQERYIATEGCSDGCTKEGTDSFSDVKSQTKASEPLVEVKERIEVNKSESTSAKKPARKLKTISNAAQQSATGQAAEHETSSSTNHETNNRAPSRQVSPKVEGAMGISTTNKDNQINIETIIENGRDEGGTNTGDTEAGFQTVTRANKRNKRKAKANKNRQNTEPEVTSPRSESAFRNTHETNQRRSEAQSGPQSFNRATGMIGNHAFIDSMDGHRFHEQRWEPPFVHPNDYERHNLRWTHMNHFEQQQEQERLFFNTVNGGGSGWYNRYQGMAQGGHRGRV